MSRVLRPGGQLILVDHIESTSRVVRAMHRFLEIFTVALDGEHFLRRPLNIVQAAGFTVERVQRFKPRPPPIMSRIIAGMPSRTNPVTSLAWSRIA